MAYKVFPFALLLGLTAVHGMAQPTNQADPLKDFKKRAATFNSVITLPQFELNTNEIRVSLKQTMAVGNAALDRLAALNPKEATFQNTIGALDDINYQIGLTGERL